MEQKKQLKLIVISATMIVAAVFLFIVLKAQGILDKQVITPVENKKVAILTTDVVTDQSWGSLAYKGQLKIERKFPAAVQLFSEVNTTDAMKKTIKDAADSGVKLIIGHGREFSEVFAEMALDYPNVHFATLHGKAVHSNQTVYTFDQRHTEYAAALVASVKTKTNKVGLIDAYEAKEKNPGFEEGLHDANSDITFFYRVVNSRDDGKKAVELMDELVGEGVDVIYAKGNAYNRDIINAAKQKGVYVIGYLDDQSYMGKEQVLTSVVNDVPQAYVSIMEDFFSKKGIPAGTVVLDEKDGVYKLAPLGPMYTKEEKEDIQSQIQAINRNN
ncbi:BMP family ABC transporter substrate-binding protein [Priestia megaterium]|nr:BMP family ABC transporter substrate-binding protein [Priestia megaterium]